MSAPTPNEAYDPVAELYDRAFADIRVRRAEWRWVERRLRALPVAPRVLEIGCGTGALLRALAPSIETGVGVDVSSAMIARAQLRSFLCANLTFQVVDARRLPFEAARFELVVSFLSFRYLDWDRILPEIRRVLAPGGRFWMIDLASARAELWDAPRLMRSALRRLSLPLRAPRFARDLSALTSHPEWHAMLARHPARPLDAYRSLFDLTFPGRKLEVLDVTPTRQVVAFDSGPLFP